MFSVILFLYQTNNFWPFKSAFPLQLPIIASLHFLISLYFWYLFFRFLPYPDVILFHFVLFSSVLYPNLFSFCSILFCSFSFCSFLFISVHFCSFLFFLALFSFILFCSIYLFLFFVFSFRVVFSHVLLISFSIYISCVFSIKCCWFFVDEFSLWRVWVSVWSECSCSCIFIRGCYR